MESFRKQRIAELIRDNISYIIQRDVSSKLPALATVMRVEMSNDLKYANIFVSFYGTHKDKEKSFRLIKRELKNIRMQLGNVLNLRYIPYLTIIEDSSLDHAFRIEELLKKMQGNDGN